MFIGMYISHIYRFWDSLISEKQQSFISIIFLYHHQTCSFFLTTERKSPIGLLVCLLASWLVLLPQNKKKKEIRDGHFLGQEALFLGGCWANDHKSGRNPATARSNLMICM